MGWIAVDLAKILGPIPGIFVMSMCDYPPVGILLVPPGASFDPVMSKWHYGHVHKNITCLNIERRMLYHDGPPFPEMKRINA